MRYALLIYVKPGSDDGFSDEQRAQVSAEYAAIGQDERVVGGGQLSPVETATTVRVQDERMLTTDGPFADTKEVFGGYYVVEADDLDQALQVAARIPAARMGGSVEVRPLLMELQR